MTLTCTSGSVSLCDVVAVDNRPRLDVRSVDCSRSLPPLITSVRRWGKTKLSLTRGKSAAYINNNVQSDHYDDNMVITEH